MRTIGGHLCPGTLVNTTCEVVLLALEGVQFARVFDPETGYHELDIRPLP